MGRTSDARERILKSAMELFHAKGYGEVGVSELCDHAGVKKGSFYHFFPSKRDAVLAALDEYDLRYGPDAVGRGLDPELPPLDRIRALFMRNAEHQRLTIQQGQPIQGCLVGNMALELSGLDKVVQERLESILAEWTAFFERAIQDAVTVGDLPETVNPRTNARAVLAYVQGTVMMAKTYNNSAWVSELAEGAIALASVSSTLREAPVMA